MKVAKAAAAATGSKSRGRASGQSPARSRALSDRFRFMGYRRANGRIGGRHHVIILPVDDLSNAACEAVANNIKGTLATPHSYWRFQLGGELGLLFRTLIRNRP